MKTNYLLLCILCSLPFIGVAQHETDNAHSLPKEKSETPVLPFDYFPSRMHAFIWRNWTLIPANRLAEVLQTTAENVSEIAISMGLSPQTGLQKEWTTSRGYITVLRRNWHLLPYEQLLTLLGMSRQELSWRLIEDDFLIIKLGDKPVCPTLLYNPPTAEINKKAHQIAQSIHELNKGKDSNETPRFNFIHEYATAKTDQSGQIKSIPSTSAFDLRIIFSYFTDYGDPLIEPELSSYPEGLLQKLSESGINGIWIHSVLRMLIPHSGAFPGVEDYQLRINGLRKLVARAAKYGIGIYLYANEPRSMPASFFDSSPERTKLGGVKENDMQSFCTSAPGVLDWLSDSYERVFREVPGLAGVFTITASENLTSCVSHSQHANCPNCRTHSYSDLIVGVNAAITKGVRRGNPDAKVLVWDWGWNDKESKSIIEHLPKSCWLMSVSEWSLPIERGGIKSAVGEYSISSVGPGPRALTHWKIAKESGLKTMAKVQVNSSWEISIVPSLPVMDLVAQHAENLAEESTDGVFLSWSLGGFPSDNLAIFQAVKKGTSNAVLDSIATTRYGNKAAPSIRKAWSRFSEAYKEYPYHITTLYFGPQQMGPANPYYLCPTGFGSTMVGFPYDDLKRWCSIYPVDVWRSQMSKMANGFKEGCELLAEAKRNVSGKERLQIESDMGQAEAVSIHFRSCADQAGFVDARDRYLSAGNEQDRKRCLEEMRVYVSEELDNVKQLLPLVRKDPTIGYESSNQYFYVPTDLEEKWINLQYISDWIDTSLKQQNVH